METRNLSTIAQEIEKTWKNVNFGARPYLDAMHSLRGIDEQYGYDDAKSIVIYFQANATGWRGDDARRIKAELKEMIRG